MDFKFNYLIHILAIILIVFGSVLIYQTHFKIDSPTYEPEVLVSINESLGDYPYPLHADSWNHLSLTKQLLEESWSPTTNPQLSEEYFHISKERGFHVFLALTHLITGVPLLNLFVILPAILFAIGVGLLYLFFAIILKKPLGGLFSVIFMLFIPSNANALGMWFLTPLSMTLPFLAGLLLLLFGLKKPKNLIFSGILIFISFFVYPVMTVLFLFLMLIYLVVEFKLWNHLEIIFSRKYIIPIFAGSLLFLMFVYSIRMFFVFPPDWTSTVSSQTLITYLPIFLVLLALGGFYFLYSKNKFLFFSLGFYSIFGIIMSLLYLTTNYTFILPYQRILFQWSILLIISAAYFMDELIILILEKTSKLRVKKTVATFFLLIFFISLILLMLLPNYYVVDPYNYAIQRMVHNDQKVLLDSINTVESKNILADVFFSTTIHSLSKHKAILTTVGNLEGGNSINYHSLLKRQTCAEVLPYFSQENIDFVIINKKLNCSFLNELMISGDYYLYLVKSEELPLPIERVLS